MDSGKGRKEAGLPHGTPRKRNYFLSVTVETIEVGSSVSVPFVTPDAEHAYPLPIIITSTTTTTTSTTTSTTTITTALSLFPSPTLVHYI
ncbi:hypothetical protein E2C01_071962 [Portunus trituberculatus]|uniref:Uncharacterized protein n=1 Tax=Portunus trituberculatus TaxID=210409 RepID=A0A5B7I5V5_PORTR|nr:hypothetical protein [Portunus trituberculatus]